MEMEAPGHQQSFMIEMNGVPGMLGTFVGRVLRIGQFFFAACVFLTMTWRRDYMGVVAFRVLVVVSCPMMVWSVIAGIIEINCAVGQTLRSRRCVRLFAFGDGVVAATMFFSACASAGFTVLMDNDLKICAINPCFLFKTATALAFFSFLVVSPSFVINFYSLTS